MGIYGAGDRDRRGSIILVSRALVRQGLSTFAECNVDAGGMLYKLYTSIHTKTY